MGPVLGAMFGAFVYDAFLYTGEENILNRLFVIFLSIVPLMNLYLALAVGASRDNADSRLTMPCD